MASLALPDRAVKDLYPDRVQSFERLFEEEYRRVVSIAYRVVGDDDEAEDVAQEAFVQFHRRYEDGSGPRAWLYRAAAHVALNRIRARRRRSAREELHGSVAAGSLLGEDPAMSVVRSEQNLRVRRILSRIPQKSATVLALRYSGLSYGEIAQTMKCNVGSVGTVLRRAEAAFRKELESEAHQ